MNKTQAVTDADKAPRERNRYTVTGSNPYAFCVYDNQNKVITHRFTRPGYNDTCLTQSQIANRERKAKRQAILVARRLNVENRIAQG